MPFGDYFEKFTREMPFGGFFEKFTRDRPFGENSEKLNLTDLSMGMSADYGQAILNGSTYLRLGTAIFGSRNI